MIRFIAIVGKICSGKTTFLNVAKKLGYKVFIADQFINDLYIHSPNFLRIIKEKFGDFVIENNAVSKDKIKQLISLDKSVLTFLESVINDFIKEEFEKNDYDFAELPILKNDVYDFTKYVSQIWNMEINLAERIAFCNKRNVSTQIMEQFDKRNNFNWETMEFFENIKVVNIPLNMRNNSKKIEIFIKKWIKTI
ncbi:dephospho-CoA kinase [Mycoplasmopsis gallinacea]|uniref:Dephospho-CoA kinase n=1 Tax=Mycoplasmopsis gallinacea TaxID=29556 RepID=A0A449A3Z6_9BACT|nr:dephospho-CoA kinase [Mycoplasmopsis gallinacea]VEU58942.1 dephospho-CoA kinase [Mycoplasmopsis gallinacea]